MIQSSRKSMLLRTFRPHTRVMIMAAEKHVHHQLYSKVGLFDSLVRGSGGGWLQRSRERWSSGFESMAGGERPTLSPGGRALLSCAPPMCRVCLCYRLMSLLRISRLLRYRIGLARGISLFPTRPSSSRAANDASVRWCSRYRTPSVVRRAKARTHAKEHDSSAEQDGTETTSMVHAIKQIGIGNKPKRRIGTSSCS